MVHLQEAACRIAATPMLPQGHPLSHTAATFQEVLCKVCIAHFLIFFFYWIKK